MRKLHKHKIIHTIFGKNISIIKDAFSPELFREEGHKLIDKIADYLSNCCDRKIEQAIPWSEPDDLLAHRQKNVGRKDEFYRNCFRYIIVPNIIPLTFIRVSSIIN